ncbi:related to pirin-related protein [Saccharomycodes ludwigii]|uniref:Related to pirin-related protein n=2 Tax=Saccharomycodes ludwigii TaxID=36035 RepID=A0A376B7R2_9ASCO|nr:related to pirin-related protein [Saccharomycodes ludwigii]
MNQVRSVLKHFIAIEQSEGMGARVRRSVGTHEMRKFLPFLMLDHFTVAPPAGFPDHPHHGQETITYIIEGAVAHEDITGSRGVLRPGDLQFMTAGRGIVHSEIPVSFADNRASKGLQLWVDLPEKLKNTRPRYRDLRREEIPTAKPNENVSVKVISGNSYGVESLADLAYTPIHFYYFTLNKNNVEFEQGFPKDFNVFLYVLKGSVSINKQVYPQYSAVFFKADGDSIRGVSSSENTEFAVIGGRILDQEVVHYGPFVETSKSKLIQVIKNYQEGKNGFERAQYWTSSISNGIDESRAKKILQQSNLTF